MILKSCICRCMYVDVQLYNVWSSKWILSVCLAPCFRIINFLFFLDYEIHTPVPVNKLSSMLSMTLHDNNYGNRILALLSSTTARVLTILSQQHFLGWFWWWSGQNHKEKSCWLDSIWYIMVYSISFISNQNLAKFQMTTIIILP